MNTLNETHDPSRQSWLESANQSNTDFPIQNLPFAIFRPSGEDNWRGGVAIGDQIIDLAALASKQVFTDEAKTALEAAAQSKLNQFMALGKSHWSALRLALSQALRLNSSQQSLFEPCLVNQNNAEYALPCTIGDFTDFYTSIYHATAVGKQFRPDNPLLPNYKWVPIGYHGRASSIDISGQKIHRPIGQLKPAEAEQPQLGPCKRLDFELEVGIFVGTGNDLGQPISIESAEDHVFGLCLLNDWSARDIQAWEYQPLGPFLSKSFASTISPWIVTTEALAPFREGFTRTESDPQPLPYLSSEKNTQSGSFDLNLEVLLSTTQSRQQGLKPMSLSQSNFKHSYWTVAQMIAHHSVNGCNLCAGDLFGSGTQSGPNPQQAGSLLELSQGGKKSIELSSGERRTFLEDGDSITLRAWCSNSTAKRIGFGEALGTILPAHSNY